MFCSIIILPLSPMLRLNGLVISSVVACSWNQSVTKKGKFCIFGIDLCMMNAQYNPSNL